LKLPEPWHSDSLKLLNTSLAFFLDFKNTACAIPIFLAGSLSQQLCSLSLFFCRQLYERTQSQSHIAQSPANPLVYYKQEWSKP
jgi:hypothetical protein